MRRPVTLRSSAEFERVIRGGLRGEKNGVVVFALRAPQGKAACPARLGLVVRAPKRSVIRNRIKRRLRAAFVACNPPAGYDVVIRADERAEAMDFTDLTEALSRALSRGGVPVDSLDETG